MKEVKCVPFYVVFNDFLFVSQGSNVKTDYGPLLRTLAEFGWLLTCVLPTPIIRHDRQDPHSTSHIIMFLYTPSMYAKLTFFYFLAVKGILPPSKLFSCKDPSRAKRYHSTVRYLFANGILNDYICKSCFSCYLVQKTYLKDTIVYLQSIFVRKTNF